MAPEKAEFHLRAAMSAWSGGRHAIVERHLLRALELSPNLARGHEALSQWYMEEGEIEPARRHIQIASGLAPDDRSIIVSRAFLLAHSGEPKAAWESIAPLVAGDDTPGRVALLYGRIAGEVGQMREALELIERLLARRAEALPERGNLHFIAAALLDETGEYDRAFEHLRLAHGLARGSYDPRENTRLFDGLIAYFDQARFRTLPRATHGNRRPVFIVGMPRSGTSLIEQILASHPSIYGAGELKTLGRIACGLEQEPWARGQFFPKCMESFSTAAANELAGRYLSAIERLNASAPFVTDKLPVNFRDLWLVQILFPVSPVIHCTRDPRDTCLSCCMRDFAGGNQFTHNLSSLGAFYRDYQRLMDHWRRVLDLPILDVSYENVVSDLEGEGRRLLNFLDLPWDDRCLGFHKNRRYVGTASKYQVRRPIYQSSVGRWRNYEAHLGPLFAALEGRG